MSQEDKEHGKAVADVIMSLVNRMRGGKADLSGAASDAGGGDDVGGGGGSAGVTAGGGGEKHRAVPEHNLEYLVEQYVADALFRAVGPINTCGVLTHCVLPSLLKEREKGGTGR